MHPVPCWNSAPIIPLGPSVLRPQPLPLTTYSFTGKEFDKEIGLYYFGARYYDPTVGHFISVDPLYFENLEKDLVDPQALNLYSYVHNNPLRNIDPDGRDVVIAYGTGDGERGSRSVSHALARELRQNNVRVYVIKATDLNKRRVQRRMARRNISAAVFSATVTWTISAIERARYRDGGRGGLNTSLHATTFC